ncbi:DUF4302 domain-containing protein [Polaribacter sp. HaHaR_3_91]|uniref:DUF4302 domain-containing protein n=1 Tax=Polaribacter sp. HaHaR_3_91 TaxID=2745561 RepID=UPI001C4FBEE0|nr:DUF4302 domain-containing protein [Polaribacter sp. HaHaR_3_91]QXP62936.1 DUF4302 domain-containing protein [Polaribacter sp. HaHaR_3_91]
MKIFKINRYQLILAFCLVVFNSCQDNSDPELLFDDVPTVRIEKSISELKTALQDSENGWKTTYFTDDSELGGFTFLFDFISDSEVIMDSDFGTPDVTVTSLYDITLGSTIKLTFTSKNVIHELSDSNNYPDDDLRGQGYKGSFEFLYFKTVGEEIFFKSNRDRDIIISFSKASKEDWTSLTTQNRSMLETNIPIDPLKSVFRNLTLESGGNTTLYSFSFNEARRYATVTAISKDVAQTDLSFGLAPTPTGFVVSPAIEIDNVTLDEFIYSVDNDEFVAEVDGVKMTLNYADELSFLLPFYDFGNESRGNNNMRLYRTNLPNSDLSSENFINFYKEWEAHFTATQSGRTVTRVYLYNLDTSDNSFVQVRYLSSGRSFSLNFKFTYTVTEDATGNKIYKLTETIPVNTTRRAGILPLLDFLFRDSGFYVQKMVDFNANQNTLGLIPVDDTTMLAQWYDF